MPTVCFYRGRVVRLVKEGSCVELCLDGVVFDLQQKPGTFWDNEPEDRCDYTRNYPDSNDPPPHDIHSAGQVFVPLASAGGNHNQ